MSAYRAQDFANEDCPPGYQTAWGWLAKHEPASFEFMQEPGRDAREYQERAAVIAREEGIERLELAAPPAIQETGGPPVVLAFPNIVYRCVFASL